MILEKSCKGNVNARSVIADEINVDSNTCKSKPRFGTTSSRDVKKRIHERYNTEDRRIHINRAVASSFLGAAEAEEWVADLYDDET